VSLVGARYPICSRDAQPSLLLTVNARAKAPEEKNRLEDVPLSPAAKITIERRGQMVLIGINRPYIHNRTDPDASFGLAKVYYDCNQDPSLRAVARDDREDSGSTWVMPPSKPDSICWWVISSSSGSCARPCRYSIGMAASTTRLLHRR
jgi:hypothetical protein